MLVGDVFLEIDRLRKIEADPGRVPDLESILDLGQSFDRTHDWLASGRQALKLVGLDKGKAHTHPELVGFAAAWSDIAASITGTDIPEGKSHSNPILFASNLGNFDAVCIRDKSDRFAVGFDLGFLRGLDQLAHVISASLNGWAIHGYCSEEWTIFKNPSPPSNRQCKWISSILNSVIAHGGASKSGVKDTLVDNMSDFFSMFGRSVARRLWTFILAHEYSHYLLDHHNENSMTNRRFREADLDATMEKARKNYQNSEFTHNAFAENFLTHQALEYHADWQALRILEKSAEDQPDEKMRKLAFISDITAITIFFAYADAIERLSLVRTVGADPGQTPLFREDAEVAELFIRSGYPSPYRRWLQIMHDVDERRLGGNGAISLFVDPVWNAIEQAIGMERFNAKLHHTAGEVHDKWKNRIQLAAVFGRDFVSDVKTDGQFPMQAWNLPEHVL